MKKLWMMSLIIGFMVVFMTTVAWGGNEVIEKTAKGSIDWTNGFIIASGSGVSPEGVTNRAQARLMAERAALTVAYRNLLEVVQGVRVNSETTVENFVLKSDLIKSEVNGFVKGATIVPDSKTGEDYTYLTDGTVKVVIKAPLDGRGGLAEVLFPSSMRTEPLPEAKPEAGAKGPIYTGLVIDTRGIKIKPALAPKVIDENGREVYGTGFVSRQYAVEQGIAGYAKDIEVAKKDSRVTDNPIVVKGIKASGPNSADVVINNADAQTILGLGSNLNFLDKCRVIIVVR